MRNGGKGGKQGVTERGRESTNVEYSYSVQMIHFTNKIQHLASVKYLYRHHSSIFISIKGGTN